MINNHPLKIKKTVIPVPKRNIHLSKNLKRSRVKIHEITTPENVPVSPGSQYQLVDLKKQKNTWLATAQNKLKPRIEKIKVISYWKNFLSVGALMTSIFFVGFLIFMIVQNYNNISDTFPLFFSQATQTWKMSNKESLPLFAMIIAASSFLILKFNHSIYVFDRRLSTLINIGLILFNILGLIAFSEVFSLILIN